MTSAERIDDFDEPAAIASMEATIRQEEEKFLRESLAALRPTARIVYRHLLQALPTSTRRSIASRRQQLLILRMPSAAWVQSAIDAMDAATMSICGVATTYGQFGSASIPRALRLGNIDVETVLKDLYNKTVCCFVAGSDELPTRIAALADFDFRIEPLTADTIGWAFSTRFPDRAVVDLGSLPVAAVTPDALDLALKKGIDGDDAIRLLRALCGSVPTAESSGGEPRLEDLHGYGEAREWGLQLVADLAAFQAGRIAWADVDSGCLLVGPPGTGKTLFASALAQSAGCAFLPTSYADWQSAKTGHLGDLMKRMRQVFEDAASRTPAIVFIDEIDSLPARGSATGHDDWWRSITNGLLECLDGTSRREGVVILAACNDGTNLDPALVRSGRLDRRFRIELPDETALVGIFRSHLGDGISDDVLQPIATALAGTTSGADIVRMARDARRVARLAGRDVVGEDILSVALPPETRSATVIRRVAIHEAGHAVVYMLFGRTPASLSIVRDADTAGGVVLDYDAGSIEGLRRDIEAMVVPILAGRAAEEAILGNVSAGAGGSGSSDLGRATGLRLQLEAELGLGTLMTYGQQVDGATIEIRLRRLYAEALLLVARHRSAIIALSELAMERRVLGRATLESFAKTHLV